MLCSLVVIATVLSPGAALSLNSCSRNRDGNKVKVLIFDVNPAPIKVPGQFTVGGTVQVMEDLNGTYSADVKVERESFLVDVDLPCEESTTYPGLFLGTCHYSDLCKDLADLSAKTKANGTTPYCEKNGFPCACPIPKGVYKLPPYTFTVPALNLLSSLFSDGSYKIRVAVRNEVTREEVACYQGQVTLGNARVHNQTAILEGTPRPDGIDIPVVG